MKKNEHEKTENNHSAAAAADETRVSSTSSAPVTPGSRGFVYVSGHNSPSSVKDAFDSPVIVSTPNTSLPPSPVRVGKFINEKALSTTSTSAAIMGGVPQAAEAHAFYEVAAAAAASVAPVNTPSASPSRAHSVPPRCGTPEAITPDSIGSPNFSGLGAISDSPDVMEHRLKILKAQHELELRNLRQQNADRINALQLANDTLEAQQAARQTAFNALQAAHALSQANLAAEQAANTLLRTAYNNECRAHHDCNAQLGTLRAQHSVLQASNTAANQSLATANESLAALQASHSALQAAHSHALNQIQAHPVTLTQRYDAGRKDGYSEGYTAGNRVGMSRR